MTPQEKGLLMHIQSESWPMWSDTEDLLEPTLLRKFLMVLTGVRTHRASQFVEYGDAELQTHQDLHDNTCSQEEGGLDFASKGPKSQPS